MLKGVNTILSSILQSIGIISVMICSITKQKIKSSKLDDEFSAVLRIFRKLWIAQALELEETENWKAKPPQIIIASWPAWMACIKVDQSKS